MVKRERSAQTKIRKENIVYILMDRIDNMPASNAEIIDLTSTSLDLITRKII